MKHALPLLALCLAAAPLASADDDRRAACRDLPTASQLKAHLNGLNTVPAALGGAGGQIGGLFNGARMWAAVVNRDGEVCAAVTSTNDPSQVWPGSQAIAKAKAYTANAFSLDDFALSTARLYTFTQPGHSLWSLGQSNLFDAGALASPDNANKNTGKIAGGLIFFGGGLPIYKAGKIIGGLGISGDTSCADHEVAKRVRHLAGLNPAGGALADDIKYSSVDGAGVFTHPLCIATYRNGVLIGQEANSSGY
ncbi:MAG: heme-binding protein [Bryobacterales bacterium]|nr:heme-binding protein [Bryobacterales bacterium]